MSPILEALGLVLTGAGTGGLITACSAAYSVRKKVPAETDSIIVNGAEKAVIALQAVLEAETARADRAEARALLLEGKLDEARALLDEVRDELHALTQELSARDIPNLPKDL